MTRELRVLIIIEDLDLVVDQLGGGVGGVPGGRVIRRGGLINLVV